MAFTVTVTAGKQFAETEPITIPKLNQLAGPTVVVSGSTTVLDDVEGTAATTDGQVLVWDQTTDQRWEVSTASKQVGRAYLQVMSGATDSLAGASGAVPQPQAGDENAFLKGDGTFGTPAGAQGSDLYLNENLI